jgi:hypothetical protein
VEADEPAATFRRHLGDRTDSAVAVGFGDRAIRALVAAVADLPAPDAGPICRLVVTPATADRIRNDLVRATSVDEHRAAGRLRLAVADDADETDGAFLSTPEVAVGLVEGTVGGRVRRPSPIVDDDPDPAIGAIAEAWVDRATPADRGPGRAELVAAARESLSPAFAADVEAALGATDRLPRVDPADPTRPDARSLLVAAGARSEHLLRGVRTFAGEQGIAHSEAFAGVKRRLVDVGLVETVAMPRGTGRPPIRLRPADPALADCEPAALLALLRERLATLGSDSESESDGGTGPAPCFGRDSGSGSVDHPEDFDRRAGRTRPCRERPDRD